MACMQSTYHDGVAVRYGLLGYSNVIVRVEVTSKPDYVLQVMLALTFLRSYSNVGKVKVECVSGCTCKPKVFDAKNTRPTSELHTERMEVSLMKI